MKKQFLFKLFYFILILNTACTKSGEKSNDTFSATDIQSLDKQVIIYETLEHHRQKMAYLNNAFLEGKIARKDTFQLQKVKELREQTLNILKKIDLTRYFIYANIGGEYDSLGYTIKKPFEIEKVEDYLLGRNKNGKAYELVKDLDKYIDFLNSNYKAFVPEGFTALTSAFKENPLFKKYPELKSQDFVETKFKNTPALTALAILSQIQNQILIYETNILENIVKMKR
jgi:hypothetical protein